MWVSRFLCDGTDFVVKFATEPQAVQGSCGLLKQLHPIAIQYVVSVLLG
jgi:hypothetical protein